MRAQILTIGDELLIGQVVNTNAAWMGEQLNMLGVSVDRVVVVGDREQAIQGAVGQALDEADVVILTGGLGPTHDDITREAVAGLLGKELLFRQDIYEALRERFERRGRPFSESNRQQALVPEGFEVLPNPLGSAPGLWYSASWGGQPRYVALVPGVPREMKVLLQQEVIPRLQQTQRLRVILHRTLLTAGIGESNLHQQVGDLSAHLNTSVRLAYLPSTQGVRLRLTAEGEDRTVMEQCLDALEETLFERIEPYIYGRDMDSLEAVVGRMMVKRGLTIAAAESCTGGLVTHRLTNVPGSSAYVIGSVVAYSDQVKVDTLGVEKAALAAEGAVSEEVARQMAEGVRTRLGTDLGVSATGVAGPSGGTPEKPVGTVWIGYADAHNTVAKLLRLTNDRQHNKELAATAVLNLIRRQLLH